MRSLGLSWIVLLSAFPGCGLALDYDPPSDAGADVPGLDAPGRDAPSDGGTPCVPDCDPGSVCLDGTCFYTCDVATPCHFDDTLCEICDLGRGVCVPSDVTCAGGCLESCNPASDVCEPNCPVDQSCLGGTCRTAIPCSGAMDCAAQLNRCGDPAVCGPLGFCEDVVIAACRPYECATTDECEGCLATPAPGLCTGATPLCDESGGRYRCVSCLRNADCTDASLPTCDATSGQCAPCASDAQCAGSPGGPHCDAAIGACVPCVLDEHCLNLGAPICDVATHRCVPCLVSADCRGGQVCRPDHTCGGCSADSDCGPWAECLGSVCQARACDVGRLCPSAPCATVRCNAGFCAYSATAAGPSLCNDRRDCTLDSCAPTDPRADTNGCVHALDDGRCDDSIDCTVDLCAGLRDPRPSGCAHRPNPALCGGPTACSRWLCLPEGLVSGFVGCQAQYFPDQCGTGAICSSDGNCVPMSGCDSCDDDGFACNGTERCVMGACAQTLGAGGCNGACNNFCANDTSCGMIGPVALPCAP